MKKLVELTTLWEYEDTSGGMKPPQHTMDLQFDPISQLPTAIPSDEAIMAAIGPGLQGVKEKESSNGHDIGTFAIFHILNHNIRSER
jgi:hypothetical protein